MVVIVETGKEVIKNISKLYLEDKETEAGLYEVIKWWLEHYKGIEHLTDCPETWYSINSILERSFNKIKNKLELK